MVSYRQPWAKIAGSGPNQNKPVATKQTIRLRNASCAGARGSWYSFAEVNRLFKNAIAILEGSSQPLGA